MNDPNTIHPIVNWLPFIGMAVGDPRATPVLTRLIEAAIIGGVVMYGTVEVLQAKVEAIDKGVALQVIPLQKGIDRIERRVDKIEMRQIELLENKQDKQR